MANQPALVRAVFICLWSMADDEGRLEGDALAVWRFGSFREDSREIASSLETLCGLGRVVLYEAEGNPYVQVVNFNKHQRIDHPSKSKYPAYTNGCDLLSESSRVLSESSRIVAPDLDQGAGIKEQGTGSREGGLKPPPGPLDEILPSNIPYKEIVALYNNLMEKLPRVRHLNNARRELVRKAWQSSKECQVLTFWKQYFEECSNDDFLNGTGPYRGEFVNWSPTFDYLMRTKVIVRTHEKALHILENSR